MFPFSSVLLKLASVGVLVITLYTNVNFRTQVIPLFSMSFIADKYTLNREREFSRGDIYWRINMIIYDKLGNVWQLLLVIIQIALANVYFDKYFCSFSNHNKIVQIQR